MADQNIHDMLAEFVWPEQVTSVYASHIDIVEQLNSGNRWNIGYLIILY